MNIWIVLGFVTFVLLVLAVLMQIRVNQRAIEEAREYLRLQEERQKASLHSKFEEVLRGDRI